MTASARIRVLVVDDSALMRRLIADLLQSAPEIEVVGTARDGDEAIAMAARLRPDVITLDVEMPGKSGLEVLPEILALYPFPVVMVSALTQEGAEVTLEAMERGAVDFFPKPDQHQMTQLRASRDLLVAKIIAASHCRVKDRGIESRLLPPGSIVVPASNATARCIAIGISTGGPQALGRTLPLIQPPTAPLLIVQHMPPQFTDAFARRLGRACRVPVKEAADGDPVVEDQILIAPGGRHMTVSGTAQRARVKLSDEPPVSGHRPSVDALFLSVAATFKAGASGIVMTGMGRDGVTGCKRILEAGGATYGQDESTSVIYGMNKAAFLEGALLSQFALDELPAIISKLSRR